MPDDTSTRNVAPRLSIVTFWGHLGAVALAGLVLAAYEIAGTHLRDFSVMGPRFYVVALLLVLFELRPLITAGAIDGNGVTPSTSFVFALLMTFGLAPAILMQVVATMLADRLSGKAWWRSAFNVGQYALSFGAASGTMALLGMHPTPLHPTSLVGHDLPTIAAGAVAYFVANNLLVARLVAIRSGTSLYREFFGDFGYLVAAEGTLLAVGCLVAVVMARSAVFVPLFVLPLIAVYATAMVSLEKEHQALHDALTGLPNRKLILERSVAALDDARRHGSSLALFILDLDRFKEVNDTLGHQVGDSLLQLVAARLQQVLRPVYGHAQT
jgi:GGDEF domain-containing protein